MNSSAQPPQSSAQRTPRQKRRPASIAELAQRAKDDAYDERREIKQHLRDAEKYRRTAKELVKAGDLETAFVEFAKAATLVLEKLPTHRDYHTTLNKEQRHNLSLNGQDILDNLGELKPLLVDRYDKWLAAHPNAIDTEPPLPRPNSGPTSPHRQDSARSTQQSDAYQRVNGHQIRSSQDDAQRARLQAETRQRLREENERTQQQRSEAESQSWRQQREQYPSMPGPGPSRGDNETRRREEASRQRELELTFGGMSISSSSDNARRQIQGAGSGQPVSRTSDAEQRRLDDAYRLQQWRQQEDIRHGEETMRHNMELKRTPQDDRWSRGQQESERRTAMSVSSPSPSSYQSTPSGPPVPTPVRAPQASRPLSFLGTYPQAMPLESPTRYDGDSTDSESVGHPWKTRTGKSRGDSAGIPPRTPVRGPMYPPPITTTSPPPPDIAIRYPDIMSQHQKSQGYVPSLHSMFNPVMKPPTVPSSLLFESDSKERGGVSHPYLSGHHSSALYPSSLLPQPSMPVSQGHPQPYGPGAYAMHQQQHQQQQQQQQARYAYSQQQQSVRYPDQPEASRPPVPPHSAPPHPSQPQTVASSRIVRAPSTSRSADPVKNELKTVNLPRECLQRFLSIAALNTSQNRETCGLLLGKDKETKYVVTTLLIPKQHATSDTCTMDEEELVLQFTEERSLITLGWIHTHPSQSCFMSSVDLHTHSGFQRMLPESFAVVCAPKSKPNFGIFRLTDPPGLQTILDCNAKEAFHPHPDLPIYTDADKGHVQMKDISMEIVDLR